MLPYDANKNERGFTLLESVSITVIIGILAAIITPNFWKMYEQFEVDRSLEQLQGALQEAQKNAVKKSQTCTVTIDTIGKKITGSSGCLLEGRNLPTAVTIGHTGSNTVNFTFRGETNVGSAKTIILYNSSQSNKKCLVISAGIGLMRTGNYIDNPSIIDSADCKVSQ